MTTDDKPRILVVDDEPDICEFIVRVLEADYIAESFQNPLEGLERLETCAVDCVVLDLFMPEIDGIEFLRRLRKSKGQDCQVIILTCTPDRFSNIGAAKLVRI